MCPVITGPSPCAPVKSHPDILIDKERAKGIHYHRVPLAVLNWTSGPPVTITALADQIEDCRRVFDRSRSARLLHRGEPGEDIHRR